MHYYQAMWDDEKPEEFLPVFSMEKIDRKGRAMEENMVVLQQLQTVYPADQQEQDALEQVWQDWKFRGDALLERDCDCHFTASALICNPQMDKVLMVHHNLYQTYAWPGGHVDGGSDFLKETLREVREETGLETVTPLTGAILSLDILPVPEQTKRGVVIPHHTHYSVAFGLIAEETQALKIAPEENSDVRWIPVSDLEEASGEPHMMTIYRRILKKMNAIASEKQLLFEKLPELLLPWYEKAHRDLPWRVDREPYHVWLSEIMLQQTRVEAVKGYYQRFLETFPTIASLAEGEEGVLLKLWEGLGYYNRARNLQKAAKQIQEQYNGVFPSTHKEILNLPGIGAYTAGAVGSICFELPTPAVDGNVLRVISRLTESFFSVDENKVKQQISDALEIVYPKQHCGAFTQSLMELGATVCVPNGAPRCEECPLGLICMARQNGTALQLPVKKKKVPRRTEEKTVFVLRCGEELAVEQRLEKGVLHGLWQLPNVSGKLEEGELGEVLKEWGVSVGDLKQVVERRHIFTHITWEMRCYTIQCAEKSPRFTWVTEAQRQSSISLPTAFRMFL